MTHQTDAQYPHGKLAAKTLSGVDGYLLALRYQNPASLGKALGALGGVIYWLPPDNDRASIWLDADSIKSVGATFLERLSYLAQFEVAETTRPCDRCKNEDVLYAGGKYGHQVRLLCFTCSRLASPTSDKALAAREEAKLYSKVLPMYRPIRKVKKVGYDLRKAA